MITKGDIRPRRRRWKRPCIIKEWALQANWRQADRGDKGIRLPRPGGPAVRKWTAAPRGEAVHPFTNVHEPRTRAPRRGLVPRPGAANRTASSRSDHGPATAPSRRQVTVTCDTWIMTLKKEAWPSVRLDGRRWINPDLLLKPHDHSLARGCPIRPLRRQ